MKYGILKSNINTGLDSELDCVFCAPLTIISNQPSYSQDMMNLKRVAASQNVQRWEIESNIEATNDSINYLVHSVINGNDTVFPIRMPQAVGVKLTSNNSMNANQPIYTNIFNINGSGVSKGEFIQFEGHAKVYLVVSGGTTITIKPSLRQAITAGTNIISGGKVTMSARYDSETRVGITYVDGILSDPGSLKFIEAV